MSKPPETVNLGDANNGNYVVSSDGKVQLIDVGVGKWSLDETDGTPRGTGVVIAVKPSVAFSPPQSTRALLPASP